ncbi:transcriptional activator NhaR [Dasania sp. GY-MA-18]|uniref:Transcriptional activator NhaR n=1 Tax=Dasania phycosphaerae TaxID=2950436 RepID=A0A9J6RPU1_9GAMM|nr:MULTISPECIES: transcriptional activator NhaR [Dasania]MCR8923887.1 transcriptional activator NhaR [Dasania sp. GY-MA-18]MCZ0866321.1 transcriptional activator NhaR [Dasania phycosphaerae]MCZ0870045.1 transcriptional activator NhaR [Dasania phycosphaerae]
MTPINYNHLYYFYVVATDGSIAKASTRLHITPQTISGQISSFEENIGVNLFDRTGKRLRLSDIGQLIYSYAEEIFQLGDEIKNILQTQPSAQGLSFNVGITDAIPKVLAYQLLKPAFDMTEPVRLICKEGDLDSLLAKMAINKLDLILTDQTLPSGSNVKAYNHQLTESGLTFFANKQLALQCQQDFPQSLSGKPFLMQGKQAAVTQHLSSWLKEHGITPNIIAEFDDAALLKSFGQAGYGVFAASTLIEKYVASQYKVKIIGRAEECKEHYYIISPERQIKHPAIVEIVNAIKQD